MGKVRWEGGGGMSMFLLKRINTTCLFNSLRNTYFNELRKIANLSLFNIFVEKFNKKTFPEFRKVF